MMRRRVAFGAVTAMILVTAMVVGWLTACGDTAGAGSAGTGSGGMASPVAARADGYVFLAPKVLRAGVPASFAFTLTYGQVGGAGPVAVALVKDGKVVAQQQKTIEGAGTVEVPVPDVSGDYELLVRAAGFSEKTPVRVEPANLLFLETDKPIYKPGQTVKYRVLTLDGDLRPVSLKTEIEVQDAKGVKVAREELVTDEFGMATAELPLSTEPNLGVWKLSARCGDASTEVDVRVEKYVLPKYEVKVDLSKTWFLVDEPITGKATARYSYGREVKGQLRVTASRYVGQWEEYATYTAAIDGEGEFRIEPAGYVAGVAEAGGNGNVRLDVTVIEDSTGYEQSYTELVTVADSPVTLQLIPESRVFKPTLPFALILVTKTPGGEPVESQVALTATYQGEDFEQLGTATYQVETKRGTAMVRLTPPEDAVLVMISATAGSTYAESRLSAAYSPSGSFVHLQQTGDLDLAVGDSATFTAACTGRASTLYYEVVARGRVVFTTAGGTRLSFVVTPEMAPSARLLAYEILPTGEVAADALPFNVKGNYPQEVKAEFSASEVRPGDSVELRIQTQGRAKVGLCAIDHSVSILAENRLNLEQVFAELERLYLQPQAELHEFEWLAWPSVMPGAKEIFADAGLVVLSNKKVPEGKKLEGMMVEDDFGLLLGPLKEGLEPETTTTLAVPGAQSQNQQTGEGLAEVQRVRQFFPETWIWTETVTDDSGKATLSLEAPDSITNWDLRAVAVSQDEGLGVAETSLTVFQPFFLTADLPYSAVRSEEFPVKVAVYNYLDTAQQIRVELKKDDWFDLLGEGSATVTVAGGEVGSVEFRIRPRTLGPQLLEVTARSGEVADAVLKSILVEPEGVSRETVVNLVVPAGGTRTMDLSLPSLFAVVPQSERAYVAVTGSLLAQTIEGLDQLLQMPFGCGEQNMILFAPDAFILKYLQSTGQLKPEIRAKAELLLTTGYQRELTYRHSDGSFSAFGEQDESGSLWLTAFVLKTFAQARDLTYIDEAVMSQAADWITGHQLPDGSFESVGFVCHSDMMGGVQGKDALTAYVAVALQEAGYQQAAKKAVSYLEKRLDQIKDPYELALVAYVTQLTGSKAAPVALKALMALAMSDEEGLHWSAGRPGADQGTGDGPAREFVPGIRPVLPDPSLDVETTGYGALALMVAGDRVNAGRAVKWLVGQRNSQGGFGTTQDTVVALQAMTEYAALGIGETDMTVIVKAGDTVRRLTIGPANFDVTQVVQVPAGRQVEIVAQGKGEALVQGVLRYNLAQAAKERNVFDIKVDYNTSQVAVNDTIDVNVTLIFDPPMPVKAGMTVLDISVPTGFAPVESSLETLLQMAKIKRYETSGRKVIFYIEDLAPKESIKFSFQAVALYPVKAKGVPSVAYSYYSPDWRGETVSAPVSVQ